MNKNLFFGCLLLLFIISIRFYFSLSSRREYRDNEKIYLSTIVASEPTISGRYQRFQIKLEDGRRISITTGKYPQYTYGEHINIAGKLALKQKEGSISYSLFYPNITELQKEDSFNVFVKTIRSKAIHIYSAFLSPDSAALLLGIILGIKVQMSDTFLQNLRSAGVMHVIAASGMNVTMVAGAMYFLFKRILARRKALVFSFLAVVLYAFVAGFEPSIVRASIMAGLTFLSGILGRQKHALYLLGLTAAFMLFLQPYLLFDVGFQLSFLATLGIMVLKPLIPDMKLPRVGTLLSEDFTTTAAAQLATTPILLSTFGSVNVLSVIINMLVLWTIPPLMIIGGIALLIGFIIEPIGQIAILATLPFLWYFEKVMALFSYIQIPLQLEKVSVFIWFGYYLLLLTWVLIYREHKKQ